MISRVRTAPTCRARRPPARCCSGSSSVGFFGMLAGYFSGKVDTRSARCSTCSSPSPPWCSRSRSSPSSRAPPTARAAVGIHQHRLRGREPEAHPHPRHRHRVGAVARPDHPRGALSWSQREFVLAARAQGAKAVRIMVREVLPNVLPAMMSIALLGIAVAIVAEGTSSILGVGVETAHAVVGQHHRRRPTASSPSRRTSSSSPRCSSSSPCSRSTSSATSYARRLDVRESACERLGRAPGAKAPSRPMSGSPTRSRRPHALDRCCGSPT